MATSIPTLEDIQAAHERIAHYVHRTPILTSQSIDRIVGSRLYFKCENFQKVGAFKARGAMNAVRLLNVDELNKGVCTHSSGNHAQALAWAARENGSKAYIVMPDNAPRVKKNAVLGYGADVIECGPALQARESTVKKVIKEKGAVFIHPFDDYHIIAGQATVAIEFYEDLPHTKLDYLLTPVGGGGLLSGTLLSTQHVSPTTKVIACEPEGADDAYRSFNAKKLIPSNNPNTVADGLLTSLSEKTYEIIIKNVADVLTVSDAGIMAALRLTWERMKIIIEPSSAVCLATVLKNKNLFGNKHVGIIISGGNVDLQSMKF